MFTVRGRTELGSGRKELERLRMRSVMLIRGCKGVSRAVPRLVITRDGGEQDHCGPTGH